MFEHMFYTKMRFVLSELMLHKKMCNARTDVTHEYEIFSVRNYATYENVICPNLCCTRKYDVLCLFENVYCPFQFYLFRIQNLDLGTASTDKWHLAITLSRSCQCQCVCKLYSKYSKKFKRQGQLHFLEFGPRQSLDQWQMVFDNPLGYILSISICMQNSITIFHSVQEIGLFSLFQNLELDIASTNDKCKFAISWARSMCMQKFQNVPNGLRVMDIFRKLGTNNFTNWLGTHGDYRTHSESQPSASLSVDFLWVVQWTRYQEPYSIWFMRLYRKIIQER